MPTCTFYFWTTHADGVPVKRGTNVHDLYHPKWPSNMYVHNKTPVSHQRVERLFLRRVPVAAQARDRAKWFNRPFYTTKITVDRKVAEKMGYVADVFGVGEDAMSVEEEDDSSDEEEEEEEGEGGGKRMRLLTPDDSLKIKMYQQEMHPGREDLEELNAAMINVLIPILVWGSDHLFEHITTWDKTLYVRNKMWDAIVADRARVRGTAIQSINILLLNYVSVKELCAAIKTACFVACDAAITILSAHMCHVISDRVYSMNPEKITHDLRGDAITPGACAKRYLDYQLGGRYRSPRIPIGMPPEPRAPIGQRAVGFLRGLLATPQSNAPEIAGRDRMIKITRMATTWRISRANLHDPLDHPGPLAEALIEFERVKRTSSYRSERGGAFMVSNLDTSLSAHAEIEESLQLLDLSAMTVLILSDPEYVEDRQVDDQKREGWIRIFRMQPPNQVASLHFSHTIDFALLEFFPSINALGSESCTHYRLPGESSLMQRVADHPQEFVGHLRWVFQPGEISQNLRWPFLTSINVFPNPVSQEEDFYSLDRYANNSEARRIWRCCQQFRVATATTPRAFDSLHDTPNAVEHIALSLYDTETGLWKNRADVEQERLLAGMN